MKMRWLARTRRFLTVQWMTRKTKRKLNYIRDIRDALVTSHPSIIFKKCLVTNDPGGSGNGLVTNEPLEIKKNAWVWTNVINWTIPGDWQYRVYEEGASFWKSWYNVLPLEVQVKIMFWVHCFYTMDKRKKVVRDLKSLPKCDLTLLPQHLGEGRWWNQVVVRLHTNRESYCHHCHRLLDHRLSVREKFFFLDMGWTIHLEHFVCFIDWHDGGIGTPHPQQTFCLFYRLAWWRNWHATPPTWTTSWMRASRLWSGSFSVDSPIAPRESARSWLGEESPPMTPSTKVMKRLELIMNVMEAMQFIPVYVH